MENDLQPVASFAIAKSQLIGISNCVDNYTSDPMITEVRSALVQSLESRDRETLLYACREIQSWYNKNLAQIRGNDWVFNYDTHLQNTKRLPLIIDALESNPAWFGKSVDIEPIESVSKKQKMVFVSHSTRDSEYVGALVDLLRKMGFTEQDLFCSSYPGYGVPLGLDIYEFLKSRFTDFELFVLFVISRENYYSSPASLNEMGAAWVLGAKSIPILLPGMEPSMLSGVVGSNSLSLVIESENAKASLNALKNELLLFFDMRQINESAWERDRDSFIDECLSVEPISQQEIEEVVHAVDEHLNDLIEDKVSLERSLYRALVKAKRSGNKPLEEWIRKELHGYDPEETLPAYRQDTCSNIRYSGFNMAVQVTKVPVPAGYISSNTMDIIAKVEYRQGIREIEDYAKASGALTRDITEVAGEISKNSGGLIKCVVVEQLIPAAFFSSILANIKEKLIEVFMSGESSL